MNTTLIATMLTLIATIATVIGVGIALWRLEITARTESATALAPSAVTKRLLNSIKYWIRRLWMWAILEALIGVSLLYVMRNVTPVDAAAVVRLALISAMLVAVPLFVVTFELAGTHFALTRDLWRFQRDTDSAQDARATKAEDFIATLGETQAELVATVKDYINESPG